MSSEQLDYAEKPANPANQNTPGDANNNDAGNNKGADGQDSPTPLVVATDLADRDNTDWLQARVYPGKLPTAFPEIYLTDEQKKNLNDSAAVKFVAEDKPVRDGGDGKGGSVKKDDQGRVVEVDYPDGKVRKFGYDESGQLNRVEQPDGQVYILKDGKWQVESKVLTPHDRDGSGMGKGENATHDDKGDDNKGHGGGIGIGIGDIFGKQDLDFQNPQVNADGTFTYGHKDGSKVTIHPDGTGETTKDGGTAYMDADGHVTKITYANGTERSFTYDANGAIKTITEGDKTYDVRDGELWLDGKPTGMKRPFVGDDGTYTLQNPHGDLTTTYLNGASETAKKDGSFVKTDASGHITEIDYTDGTTSKFTYDKDGHLESFTDKDGKEFKYKPILDIWGIHIGTYEAADGTKLNGLRVQPDGSITYVDQDGKIHADYTTGNSTKTEKTSAELNELAEKFKSTNWMTTDAGYKEMLEGLSPADRVALDQMYKSKYGESLTDRLKDDLRNPFRKDNAAQALDLLTDANLRNEVLKQFAPDQVAQANQLIDEFRERAAKQGVPLDQIIAAEDKALKDLAGSDKFPGLLLKELEKTLTNISPTLDSLNGKYGVKFEEETLPDGSKVRHYYVEGDKGAKLPVLDSTSDDPKEIEAKLKEWQDAKIKELEEKYNVKFSRDGEKDSDTGRTVDLRTPRIDELLAMEIGLAHSGPSVNTLNGKPVLVQFAVQPTSPYDAYVSDHDGQRRILFEPLSRSFRGLEDTILHEWGHNAEHNMETNNKAAIDKWYESMGYRKVTWKDEDEHEHEQWQLRDKDGNYWTQGPDQFPFGNWYRVDDQGRPLKADGSLASGFDDKDAAKRSTNEMREAAAVRPASSYFPYPWESGSESIRLFRGDAESRTELYMTDPANYQAVKEFDQAELDGDPKYGKNPDGTSRYIRLPDGTIAPNTEENRQAVAEFELELAKDRAAMGDKPPSKGDKHQHGEQEQQSDRAPNGGNNSNGGGPR